jgi:cation diffusion facilitator CzcD-associated flavoprotein CzcO
VETTPVLDAITPRANVTITPTLIIGAGPAGLAVGACLKHADVPCMILERSDKVGATWHQHYDRLHLHTNKAHSSLPFFPLPKHYPRYPSRLQMTDYFEAYAQRFHLEARFGQHVLAAAYQNGEWHVQTQNALYRARYLIVATGYNQQPYLPAWPGMGAFRGSILHSSQYRNGAAFTDQRVLVVGLGNSGGEIAVDLWEHGATPSLAVRGSVNIIPRDLFGIPIITLAIASSKLPPWLADSVTAPFLRWAIGDLTQYGLRKQAYGPMTQIHQDKRIPLIDVGTVQLVRRGQVTIYPGIKSFTDERIIFIDGTHAAFDAVIAATGYRPNVNEFLQGLPRAYDDNGVPLRSGGESAIQGLYFCGFYLAPTGMLREIAREAKQISADIWRKWGHSKTD